MLTGFDGEPDAEGFRRFSYAFCNGSEKGKPFPILNYKGVVEVGPKGKGSKGAVARWHGWFDAEGEPMDIVPLFGLFFESALAHARSASA